MRRLGTVAEMFSTKLRSDRASLSNCGSEADSGVLRSFAEFVHSEAESETELYCL